MGRIRGLKSVPLAGPHLPLQAGKRAVLLLRTLNGGIIFIF